MRLVLQSVSLDPKTESLLSGKIWWVGKVFYKSFLVAIILSCYNSFLVSCLEGEGKFPVHVYVQGTRS